MYIYIKYIKPFFGLFFHIVQHPFHKLRNIHIDARVVFEATDTSSKRDDSYQEVVIVGLAGRKLPHERSPGVP